MRLVDRGDICLVDFISLDLTVSLVMSLAVGLPPVNLVSVLR